MKKRTIFLFSFFFKELKKYAVKTSNKPYEPFDEVTENEDQVDQL